MMVGSFFAGKRDEAYASPGASRFPHIGLSPSPAPPRCSARVFTPPNRVSLLVGLRSIPVGGVEFVEMREDILEETVLGLREPIPAFAELLAVESSRDEICPTSLFSTSPLRRRRLSQRRVYPAWRCVCSCCNPVSNGASSCRVRHELERGGRTRWLQAIIYRLVILRAPRPASSGHDFKSEVVEVLWSSFGEALISDRASIFLKASSSAWPIASNHSRRPCLPWHNPDGGMSLAGASASPLSLVSLR